MKKAGRSPRSPEQARIAELERKLGKAEAESARKDEVLAEIQSHPAHVLDPLFDHVTERGGDEVLPGREVVLCGAPGDAGGGGHRAHGGRRPALCRQEIDGGTEQSFPREAATVLLGGPLLGLRRTSSCYQSCSS